MGQSIATSLLAGPYQEIISNPGSPYMRAEAMVFCGNFVYTPLRLTRIELGTDYATSYTDNLFVHLVIPKGDVVKYITPFQDDLMIELTVYPLKEDGRTLNEEEEPVYRKKCRAYLDDEVANPIEQSMNIDNTDRDMTNLTDLSVLVFRLEELSVEQLRLMRTGLEAKGALTIDVARALLSKHAKSIKLEDGETIKGPTVEPGYNPIPRNVSIPDGFELLNVPDYLQHQEGGIYSDGLGFYIANRQIWLWPLYGLKRKDTAKRTLRVFLSPDPKAQIVERTWRIPEETPDVVEIWTAGRVKVEDHSLAYASEYGTGVRVGNPKQGLGDFRQVKDNVVTVDASQNVQQFQTQDSYTNRNNIKTAGMTTNTVALAARQAKARGLSVHVLWNHSQPWLLTPGMRVEFIYDHYGEIITVEGSLVDSYSGIDTIGKGFNQARYKSFTALTLFIDRTLPTLAEWLAEDLPTATPEIEISK